MHRSRLTLGFLFAAAVACAQRGGPIPQQLTFTPYRASGIYDAGETVGWTVTPGPVAPNGPRNGARSARASGACRAAFLSLCKSSGVIGQRAIWHG
jgi:hypothetical protein